MNRSDFLAALAGAAVYGQQPPFTPDDERNRIVLDVSRVNMLFTVSDKKGRFVTELKQDDFQIVERNGGFQALEIPAGEPPHPLVELDDGYRVHTTGFETAIDGNNIAVARQQFVSHRFQQRMLQTLQERRVLFVQHQRDQTESSGRL